MQAVVYTEYGAPEVLHLREVAQPIIQANEVLVKVRAIPINYGDLLARKMGKIAPHEMHMPFLFWLFARIDFGFNQPKKHILGSEFAGVIEAVGADVTRFKPGEAVFGYRGQKMGANAEYVTMPENGLIDHKPANLTFEQAAAVPYGALTALTLLRKVNIQPGQKVLINGASGSIGSFALQLAKYYGAEVTAVCGTPRLATVKALGADHVIDYTRQDFTAGGETYDVIFDVLGKSSFARCKRALTPNGRYLLASFKFKQVFQMLWTSKFGSQKVICALSNEQPSDLQHIKELAEAGHLQAIIDRCYPLVQAAEAHRYAETGNKTGSVILTV